MICPYFYFYHEDLICKCTNEKVDCDVILEKCINKQARTAYLQDLREDENREWEENSYRFDERRDWVAELKKEETNGE